MYLVPTFARDAPFASSDGECPGGYRNTINSDASSGNRRSFRQGFVLPGPYVLAISHGVPEH